MFKKKFIRVLVRIKKGSTFAIPLDEKAGKKAFVDGEKLIEEIVWKNIFQKCCRNKKSIYFCNPKREEKGKVEGSLGERMRLKRVLWTIVKQKRNKQQSCIICEYGTDSISWEHFKFFITMESLILAQDER